MSEQRMDIFLLAAPQAGVEHAVLVNNLAAAFKKDAAAIEKMLIRPRTMVKADVTPDIAARYKILIEKSGGQCELAAREPAPTVVAVAAAMPVLPVTVASPPPPEAPAEVAVQAKVPEASAAIQPSTAQSVPAQPAAALAPSVAPAIEAALEVKAANAKSAVVGDAVITTAVTDDRVTESPVATDKNTATDTHVILSTSGPGDIQTMNAPQAAMTAAMGRDETAIAQASEADVADAVTDLAETIHDPGDTTADQDKSEGHAVCYCVKCGAPVLRGQTNCATCFTPVAQYVHKDKTTATLLALLLGSFGLHRFYLGHWWGVIYLVFCFTLIPTLVSIAEAVLFHRSSQKQWNAKYGLVARPSGLLKVVFGIGLLLLIAIAVILSVIMIPPYQEYQTREKIRSSMPLVLNSLNKVAGYIKRMEVYPSDNQTVGLPEHISSELIESISLQDGAIVQVVYRLPDVNDKATILWIPTEKKGEITWDCKRGTLPDEYRPEECLGGSAPVDRLLENAAAESTLSKKLYSDDKHISLLVPVSWEAKTLLPAAVIGAANMADENYVVVLADAKQDFDESLTLADYTRNVQLQLADNIKNGMVQGEVESLTLAGFPAQQFVFPGVVGGVKIAYVVTLIDGDKYFYRVLAWTMLSRMERNKPLLKNISESVKIQ